FSWDCSYISHRRNVVVDTKSINCDATLAWLPPFFRRCVLIQRCGKILAFHGERFSLLASKKRSLWGLQTVPFPIGQGKLRQHYIPRRKLVCIFEESRIFPQLRIPLLAEAEYEDSYGNKVF